MIKFYTFCLLIVCSLFSFAQPTVYDFDKLRLDSLAAMIMGDQATVSNVNIICPDGAGGLYLGASDLDFSNGVILTSGCTDVAFSPNTLGSASCSNGGQGYSPLEELAYNGTFNACVLEFDFVPQEDSIEVSYVFGSEEYPEYVGSSFNDIFAFIIEGLPEYPENMPLPNRNIAIIPTSPEVHVAINFLNFASYSEFYVDNTGGQEIQYDGYTTGLTAKAKVTPFNTYRLVFAIADVADDIYDSGLFIGFNNEDINPFISDYCRVLEVAAYQDDNKNGVWDAEEPPLPSQKISIEPLQQIVTTGTSGMTKIVVDTGTYLIRALESDTHTPIFQPEQTIVVEKDNELPILEFAYRRFVVDELNIHAFWDENENGVQDNDEIPLFRQAFELQPSNQQLFTDEAGQVKVLLIEGEYVLSYQQNTLWELTTSNSYFIEIGEETEELPDYYFGLKPSRILPKADVHLSSSPTRCNTTVKYFLNYTNSGTTTAKGTVTMTIDELMEYVSAEPEPDVIEEGKLIWHFSELLPSYENKIQLRFKMPNQDFIGEILEAQATVQLFNDNEELIYSKLTAYNSEVRCAYDPNDKLVQSNLLGQSDFAYIEDTIFYTVRFQNTGNDTAFNIRIEDVLDKKLDWTTFHPITASHDFHTSLDRTTGLVTFYFDDIMLPDSTTDQEGSNGFVMFGIASLENLEDKTEVDNTASIFFDFNPPIITNTAILTLIEQVETDIEVLENGTSIRVFPNPFSDYTTIEVNGLSQGDYRLEVMDILGRKVRELKSFDNGEWRMDRGDLESGLYLIRVLEENGRILGSGKILVE